MIFPCSFSQGRASTCLRPTEQELLRKGRKKVIETTSDVSLYFTSEDEAPRAVKPRTPPCHTWAARKVRKPTFEKHQKATPDRSANAALVGPFVLLLHTGSHGVGRALRVCIFSSVPSSTASLPGTTLAYTTQFGGWPASPCAPAGSGPCG